MSDSGIDDELAQIVVTRERLALEVKEKEIALKAHLRQAVAKGVDMLDLNIARRLAKSDDPAVFAAHIREIVRIGGILLPELDSEDLVAGMPQVTEETRQSIDLMLAQRAGFIAGSGNAKPEDNPHDITSPLHAEWYNAWDRGLRALEKSLGPNTRLVRAKQEKPRRREPIPGLELPRIRSHTNEEVPEVVN